MADTIAKGAVVIGANTAGLESGLKNAQKSISGFQTKITDGLSFFSTGPTGAALAGLRTAVDSVKDFSRYIQDAGDRAEKTLNDAEAFGVPAQTFSELAMAAKLSGVEIESLEKGFKQLAETAVDAAIGSEDGLKKLSMIGLKPQDLIGLDTLSTLEKVFEAINKIPNALERVKAVSDIFGKSGVKLLPLLNGDFRKEMDALRKSGASLTESEMKQLDSLADSWMKAGLAWAGAFDRIALVLGGDTLPKLLEDVATAVNDKLAGGPNSEVGGWLSSVTKFIAKGFFQASPQSLGGLLGGANLAAVGVADVAMGVSNLRANRGGGTPAVGNTTIQNAIADAQAKIAKEQAKNVQGLWDSVESLGMSFKGTEGQVKTLELAQKGYGGELLKSADAANRMKDALSAAKSLVENQSPFDLLRMQIEGLDIALRGQMISMDDYFAALGKASNSIISQAELKQGSAPTTAAIVAGSNEDIRNRIQNRMMAMESPQDQVRAAVQELGKKNDALIQLGREQRDFLKKIADRPPVQVDAR